jgi:hypothetical protein
MVFDHFTEAEKAIAALRGPVTAEDAHEVLVSAHSTYTHVLQKTNLLERADSVDASLPALIDLRRSLYMEMSMFQQRHPNA